MKNKHSKCLFRIKFCRWNVISEMILKPSIKLGSQIFLFYNATIFKTETNILNILEHCFRIKIIYLINYNSISRMLLLVNKKVLNSGIIYWHIFWYEWKEVTFHLVNVLSRKLIGAYKIISVKCCWTDFRYNWNKMLM